MISEIKENMSVDIKGVVTDIQVKKKNNGEDYIQLTISDRSGEITFPIWDEIEKRKTILKVGMVIGVKGTSYLYSDVMQIKVMFLRKIDENPLSFVQSYLDDSHYKEYVKSYITFINMLDGDYRDFILAYLEVDKEYFNTISNLLREDKEITDIISEIKDSKFKKLLLAPAAVKHHQNKLGGCLVHTVGVARIVDNILRGYSRDYGEDTSQNPILLSASMDIINTDRIMLSALLHDIEKIEEYEYNPVIKRKDCIFDHRIQFIKESELAFSKGEFFPNDGGKEELEKIQHLILSHHGFYGGYKPKTIEEMILFNADWLDSQIAKAIENNDNSIDFKVSKLVDCE